MFRIYADLGTMPLATVATLDEAEAWMRERAKGASYAHIERDTIDNGVDAMVDGTVYSTREVK